jgi:hypothetical protein
VCPPNARWNGTCYCKAANWATGTHADVMVNGACCPKNATFQWAIDMKGEWGGGGNGWCHCLDGFEWNHTACVLVADRGENTKCSAFSYAVSSHVSKGT